MMRYLKKDYMIIASLMLAIVALTFQPATAQITGDKDMEQSQQEIEVSGTVIDQSTQEPVTNATVYLSKKDTMKSAMKRGKTIEKDKTIESKPPIKTEGDTTSTDNEGEFSFMLVKSGTHTLTVEASGYERWSKEIMLPNEAQKPKQLTIELMSRR